MKQEEPVKNVRIDPVLVGSFTDWEPRKMSTLYDFLQSKEPEENKLDPESVFKYIKKNIGFGE